MWPKMLFEMLPHIGRIVPMAERFFETRKQREQEEQAQLAAISETLRTELGKAAEANAGLELALNKQAGQVNALMAEVTAASQEMNKARAAMEMLSGRVTGMEEKLAATESASRRAQSLAVVTLGLLVVVIALLALLLVRSGGR